MAEIKSTLDIIMERTKNLTMTDEEKQAFKRHETLGKVKGLIQKYQDGTLEQDRLKMEITALQGKDKNLVDELVREESAARIELGEDSEPILRMLESLIGMDTTPLREMISNFERRLSQEKEARRKVLMERLRKRGISGSAVLPNLAADPEWSEQLADLKKAFKEEVVRNVTEMENAKK